MRLYTTITAIVVLLFSSLNSSAQDIDRVEDLDMKGIVRDYIRAGRTTNKSVIRGRRIKSLDDAMFQKIALSAGLGTNGFGIRLATPINDQFKIRVGGDFLPSVFSVNKKIQIEDQVLHHIVGGYYPDYDVDIKPEIMSGHILVSYYPMEEIPFYVTAGLYFGANTFKAEGQLVNPATGAKSELVNGDHWPYLKVDDYALDISNGRLDAELKVGGIVKPYLGVGYGYIIPESNWSFNVDLGAYYQGSYKIHQNGREAMKYSNNDENTHVSSAIKIQKYKNAVRFWPTLSFQVSYRIF